MFNRIARFALCFALLTLTACAGAGRQTHGSRGPGTAQHQDGLLAELIIIGAIADAANDGDGGYEDDDDSGSAAGTVALAVGTVAIAAGVAYLVYSGAGDVDAPKRAPAPFNSTNNVGMAPGFIQAAQRGEL